MDMAAPVAASVMRAREGALNGIALNCHFLGREGVGQRAGPTGGPRCDTDAARSRAERSG